MRSNVVLARSFAGEHEVEHVDPDMLEVDERFAKRLRRLPFAGESASLAAEATRASIAQHGVLVPLFATSDWLVLDGHFRLECARAAKRTSVPVIRLPVDAADTWAATVSITLNLHRREISTAIRCALGTSLAKIESSKARERMAAGGRGGLDDAHRKVASREATCLQPGQASKASAAVAKQIGVSPATFERHQRIMKFAPVKLQKRMLSGELTPYGAEKKVRRLELARKSAREERVHEPGIYRELDDVPRDRRYHCLYFDPPWQYDLEVAESSVSEHFETMSMDELLALDVGRLVHPDGCHLWLWTTWPMIRDGRPHRLLDAWGFRWVGEVTWKKDRAGNGLWLRSITEVCILAVWKKKELLLLRDDVPGFIEAPRGQHSAKPAAMRELIESCSPSSRLEGFGRAVPGPWDVFGHEARRAP